MEKSIVLGADPEIFVNHGDGSLFPAFEFLGSKTEPNQTSEGRNVYWDGFQAEFNITPSTDIQACLASIRNGLAKVLSMAKEKDPNAYLSTDTVVSIPLSTLAELPTQYTEFGCMPSYNVYDIAGRGEDGNKVPYRFAGGHIHFGLEDKTPALLARYVQVLDAIVGVASVSLFEKFDKPVRREYYGLAGEFRTPPHGLEYRVLSDAWLFHPKLAAMMLDFARKVVVYSHSSNFNWRSEPEEVIETIICSDVQKARAILDRNKNCFKDMNFNPTIDLMAPVENSLSMVDIAKNWDL